MLALHTPSPPVLAGVYGYAQNGKTKLFQHQNYLINENQLIELLYGITHTPFYNIRLVLLLKKYDADMLFRLFYFLTPSLIPHPSKHYVLSGFFHHLWDIVIGDLTIENKQ